MCNDHAADCEYDVSSMSALCINCTDNTMGDMCEQCLPQFYQDPTLLLDNPNICIGRSMAGVVSQNCMGKNHLVTESSFSKLYSTVVLKGVARIY